MADVKAQLANLIATLKDVTEEESVAKPKEETKATDKVAGTVEVPTVAAMQTPMQVRDDDLPTWAEKGAVNCSELYPVDAQQYVAKVQIGNAVTRAMLDIGAHGSMVDKESAEKLGLDVTPAELGSFGHYQSPGYPPRPYAGIVHGPVPVRFSKEVVVQVPYLRVIDSERPQILLGVDVLGGGRAHSRWNFAGMHIETNPSGHVEGKLRFALGRREAVVTLENVPSVSRVMLPRGVAATDNNATTN